MPELTNNRVRLITALASGTPDIDPVVLRTLQDEAEMCLSVNNIRSRDTRPYRALAHRLRWQAYRLSQAC